jgi:type IX secretion system PorP/SprF family membrane protein
MKQLLTLFLSMTAFCAFAQREVQYGQYWINQMAINPAYTGARETFHLNAILRKQIFFGRFGGGGGGQSTQTFAMDGAVGENKNIGIGLQGLNDGTSGYNNTAIFANMAYHYRLSETQKISVGVSGGVNVLPVYDMASLQSQSKALAGVGAGIRYEDEMLWIGVSMPEIMQKSFSGNGQNMTFSYNRPIFFNAGTLLVMDDDWTITPSILIAKYNAVGFDINAKATYRQKIEAGLSYRQHRLDSFRRTNYFQALATYKFGPNLNLGATYSTAVPEAFSGNGYGIFEMTVTFEPNPKK